VHLAHVGCPVLCDKLFGGHAKVTRGELRRRRAGQGGPRADDDDVILDRQALHAYRIKVAHPATGEPIEFVAPVAQDIEAVLAELRDSAKAKK
jgi:23S rRNA pseudouridine1911/1915/1917 synthase